MTHTETSSRITMPQLPDWMHTPIGFAAIGTALGSAVTGGFSWLRQRSKAGVQHDNNQVQREAFALERESKLLLRIGSLEGKIELLVDRLNKLTDENRALHVETTKLKAHVTALKVEVNDVLEDAGKPKRYPPDSLVNP